MGGGTEAFPDLGQHCEQDDCNQLDFLPFTCDGCQKVFCLEHRTYKAHDCPKADHNSRVVVVCEVCAMSIEKTSGEGDEAVLERHEKSGRCHATKKNKPRCPVKRCKEILTFSNNSVCKVCHLKVCLKHRFTSDHPCKTVAAKAALPARSSTACGEKKHRVPSPPAIKAC